MGDILYSLDDGRRCMACCKQAGFPAPKAQCTIFCSCAEQYAREHSPTRQSTGITTTDDNPRRLRWLHLVTTRHSELDVVRKIIQVLDGLLDRVVLQAIHGQVAKGRRAPVEPVFENDGGAVLLLSDLTIERPVREVAGEL